MYLEALDKFMEDCGDATQYTATVSKNFTIPELIAFIVGSIPLERRVMISWLTWIIQIACIGKSCDY